MDEAAKAKIDSQLLSRDKNEMYFSLVFYFKEKNDVTVWNFSSSYCAFLDFFNIESRGAIVDEAPKAKVDSFAAFDFFLL